jgi:hypothetical protein
LLVQGASHALSRPPIRHGPALTFCRTPNCPRHRRHHHHHHRRRQNRSWNCLILNSNFLNPSSNFLNPSSNFQILNSSFLNPSSNRRRYCRLLPKRMQLATICLARSTSEKETPASSIPLSVHVYPVQLTPEKLFSKPQRLASGFAAGQPTPKGQAQGRQFKDKAFR